MIVEINKKEWTNSLVTNEKNAPVKFPDFLMFQFVDCLNDNSIFQEYCFAVISCILHYECRKTLSYK